MLDEYQRHLVEEALSVRVDRYDLVQSRIEKMVEDGADKKSLKRMKRLLYHIHHVITRLHASLQ
jgi:hypothetical protein